MSPSIPYIDAVRQQMRGTTPSRVFFLAPDRPNSSSTTATGSASVPLLARKQWRVDASPRGTTRHLDRRHRFRLLIHVFSPDSTASPKTPKQWHDLSRSKQARPPVTTYHDQNKQGHLSRNRLRLHDTTFLKAFGGEFSNDLLFLGDHLLDRVE
ncbi:MAG: hypothetical protein WD049_07375 [Candidatus Paceibacterota bacterium]